MRKLNYELRNIITIACNAMIFLLRMQPRVQMARIVLAGHRILSVIFKIVLNYGS